MTEELKPHQIAQLVNKLRDIATKYHAHGCLRELISREVNAALTQRPAAQTEREALRWTVSVEPVAVSGEPDAHCLRASIGNQAFHIGPDYMDTKQEAEFFAEMFLHAIEVGHRASLPAPQQATPTREAREAEQRARMQARLATRHEGKATADFDLPPPNDAIQQVTPEPVQLDVVRQAIEERDVMESRYHELAKSMTYKGNSVAWWHSKATAYRNAIDEVWSALKAAGIYADGAKTCADGVRELAATPEPLPLGPLAKRNIYDAIRGAYDLGYNDARNARAVPGDSEPGYDGRSVEEDHGSALFNILSKRLKPATPEPVGEPFGYFRALPFGWEQCGEHDDGAVALYTRPAPGVPDTVPVFVRMQGGDGYPTTGQWMGDGIGYLVCVPRDWQASPGVPEDVLAILDECRNALMECDRDGDYALIDRIDALAAAQAKGGQ